MGYAALFINPLIIYVNLDQFELVWANGSETIIFAFLISAELTIYYVKNILSSIYSSKHEWTVERLEIEKFNKKNYEKAKIKKRVLTRGKSKIRKVMRTRIDNIGLLSLGKTE